ncbi:MAG: GFA family protein [Erythrobacter sp.]|nr:GFA family protein [Erythrobacter sp.]
MLAGGCRCGAIRYEAEGEVWHHSICHCRDCQLGSGAPMVAWIGFSTANFRVTQGVPSRFSGDGKAERFFCGNCGTPLYYLNEPLLPGKVDVQTVTLDDPDALAPNHQVQVADRRAWMAHLGELPEFERFPGPAE